MILKQIAFFLLILTPAFPLLPMVCSGNSEFGVQRSWKDSKGRRIEASLSLIKGDTVVLIKGGRKYEFPLSRLSEVDRAYLKSLSSGRLRGAPTPKAGSFPFLTDLEVQSAPVLSVKAIEKAVFRLTNEFRKQQGINVLEYMDEISVIAGTHSRDMSDRGFFSHENPDGEDPTARAKIAAFSGLKKSPDGVPRLGFSENIGRVGRYLSIKEIKRNGEIVRREFKWQSEAMIAKQIIKGFIDSEEHRKNLLDASKAYLGVGIYIHREHVFITQNFF